MKMKKILIAFFLTGAVTVHAQDATSYKLPPKDIMELALAEPTPSVLVDGKGEWMILANRSPLSTVEELGQPEVRVAGLRINPNNFSMSRMASFTGLQIRNIKTKQTMDVSGLPTPLNASGIQWSDDESKFAFVQTNNTHVDLYVVRVAEGKAIRINSAKLNGVLGSPYRWAGNDKLIYKTVPGGERTLAARPIVPNGPVIQENLGKAVASRTYQDLIKSAYDEELFAHLATSQLVLNDMQQEKPMGAPAVYKSFSVSPDKRFLLTETIDKPYSYLVTYDGFPYTVSVMDMNGQVVNMIVKNPSAEGAPIGFDDVVTFPRDHSWKSDEPATMTYVVALDKGLGRSKAEFRDAVYAINPLTKMAPRELFRTTKRFAGVVWGDKNNAIVYENMNANRKTRMSRFDPSTGKLDSLFERSSNDAYSDVGQPWTKKNEFGRQVLFLNGKDMVMYSTGSSPEGDLPFVQTMDITNGNRKMLWRCQAPYFEFMVKVLDPEKLVIVTSRESLSEPPNYFIRDLKKRSMVGTQITQFGNPYKALEGVGKQKISYKRGDGVDLTGNLYLPKGFDPAKDKPLPVLIWAYPREYKSAADAAQVRGSKYMYPRLNWGSPIFWVTQGFAILDNAEMPIVGEGNKEPNDNFIPQLYLNAHAAIQQLAKMGVGDSNRVAVGGHSYGAFMTANLLAHTKLFKAGLARSGAYNRTLTPFGFQAEERTYWQAPDVYFNMSPFSYADKIKTPILLIHGELDNNPGTFPIQSERLYNAIKGHGGTVRYVVLPYESHGYSGKENVLHMLWEMDTWMKTYLK
jgi:dipeptidyl aminopeptidase/acylaminoacyl peptidase